MSEELKPCPFYGKNDLGINIPVNTFVHCLKCKAEGPPKDTKKEAITAWNTRAGERA